MANQFTKHHVVLTLLFVLVVIAEATPPGIAKNPSHATCKIKKYKHCYNVEHVCPKFCPDSCTVECASCKPICGPAANPPPESDNNSPPESSTPSSPSPPEEGDENSHSPSESPKKPEPPKESEGPEPPKEPTPPKEDDDNSHYPPKSSPTDHSTSPSPSPKKALCRNKYYPECYNTEHVCPSACPGGCQVDCKTCKPVCTCDRPGAVCQDPRFIGGDGITFYFHGKKDKDFCLVSDPNLHINAHFIGKRNENMKRDFTWVQSIAILFDNHKLYLGATKTSTWYDSVDHLSLAFDGQSLTLPETEGTMWQSIAVPSVSITRLSSCNDVVIEIEGKMKITAKAVPITEEDSRIHNYGITNDDCFAHLDLGFKFYSLSYEVNGVLGQTYRPDYVSRVNASVKMPVIGGGKQFATSSLFNADCAVARFTGARGSYINEVTSVDGTELPNMNCASGIDGYGVVCKR